MQNCPACGVRIDGQRARCPLCGRNLANAPAEEESTGVFPVVKPRRIYDLAFKISTFAAILILVVLNILRGLWLKEMPLHIYLILTFAVVCAWIIVNVGMRKLGNIAKGILWEGVIILLLCLPWDALTGWHGWSWGYVLPVLSASLAVFYYVMGIADSRRLTTYTGYFLITLIGAAAVAVLYFTGNMPGLYAYFAVISMSVCALLLAAQVIFRGKQFLSELQRWAHV